MRLMCAAPIGEQGSFAKSCRRGDQGELCMEPCVDMFDEAWSAHQIKPRWWLVQPGGEQDMLLDAPADPLCMVIWQVYLGIRPGLGGEVSGNGLQPSLYQFLCFA